MKRSIVGTPLAGVDIFATVYLPRIGWIGDAPVTTTNTDGSYTAQIPPSGHYAICAGIYDADTSTFDETCNPTGFDQATTPETDGILATPGTTTTVNLQFGATDQDGIPDGVEDGAPNGGDGNRDGIADSAQPNVSSFVGSTGGYITLESPVGTALRNVRTLPVADLGTPPPAGYVLPDGLVSFELDVELGAAVEVTIFSSNTAGITGYAKYVDGVWSMLPAGQVRILSDRVVITLRDGGVGDADGVANGRIVDPGGITAAPPVSSTSTSITPSVTLPRTGSRSASTSSIAAILLLLGGALVLTTRRLGNR